MKYLAVRPMNPDRLVCIIFCLLLVPPQFHAMKCITQRIKYHYTVAKENTVFVCPVPSVTRIELALYFKRIVVKIYMQCIRKLDIRRVSKKPPHKRCSKFCLHFSFLA